jgi:outer membrane protein
MRYLSLVFLSLTLCSARLAAQQSYPVDSVGSTLTLPQAVAIAMKNNLAVNQSDLNSQNAYINYNQAWEYMLPTLNGNAGQQINFGRTISSTNNQYANSQYSGGSASLNAGLILFHGLEYQNNLRATRYAWQASKMDLQAQKDNITILVLVQYLTVLSNRDQLQLAHDQAAVDSITLIRLREQAKEGALNPLSNLTDLEGQYAQDMINIATAVQSLEASKVQLFAYLNVPYNRDVEYQNTVTATDINDYNANPDSIYRTALQIIPTVKSSQLKVYEYQRQLAYYRGAYYPTVSLGASISTNWTNNPNPSSSIITDSSYAASSSQFQNATGTTPIYNKQYQGYNTYPKFGDQFKNNRGENVGISVNIPILNGFQARNNVRQARLTLKNYELQNANVRHVLQQNVELAFQNMIAAYKQFKFYQQQATAYKESFRIANIRFTEGVVASDVYILAKGHSDIAETNLAAAKYIYLFRTKVLDYYQGKLTIN